MKTEREKKLEKIIIDLVKKIRIYQNEYGKKYIGGKPFQFIVVEIKELEIKI